MKRKIIIPLIFYPILLYVLTILMFQIGINYKDINELRNYYSIVSAIASTFVGFTGLMLGLFYYFDKERRSKTSILKQSIEEYDVTVRKILNRDFNSDVELKNLRNQLQIISDRINLMIEPTNCFLHLSDNKLKSILKINSVVDNSHVINELTYADFSNKHNIEIAMDFDSYEQVLKEALIVCYKELK